MAHPYQPSNLTPNEIVQYFQFLQNEQKLKLDQDDESKSPHELDKYIQSVIDKKYGIESIGSHLNSNTTTFTTSVSSHSPSQFSDGDNSPIPSEPPTNIPQIRSHNNSSWSIDFSFADVFNSHDDDWKRFDEILGNSVSLSSTNPPQNENPITSPPPSLPQGNSFNYNYLPINTVSHTNVNNSNNNSNSNSANSTISKLRKNIKSNTFNPIQYTSPNASPSQSPISSPRLARHEKTPAHSSSNVSNNSPPISSSPLNSSQNPQSPLNLASGNYCGSPLKNSALNLNSLQSALLFDDNTKMIETIASDYQIRKGTIESLRQQQIQLAKNNASQPSLNQQNKFANIAITLENSLNNLIQQVGIEIANLNQLFCTKILNSGSVMQYYTLIDDLKFQQAEVSLFRNELLNRLPTAALAIIKQPFPKVVQKGKQLNKEGEEIIVKLITSPNYNCQTISKMTVALLSSLEPKNRTKKKQIENDTQNVDPISKITKWNLKFLNGTRKSFVQLKFSVNISNDSNNATVESSPTFPFIINTSDCQWDDSMGLLLRAQLFVDQSVKWEKFANILQYNFVKSIKKDKRKTTRCLAMQDLQALHDRFFQNQPMITPNNFETFWNFFGRTLKKLRSQKQILQFWEIGLLQGFLSREKVHKILIDQEEGCFLLRFSESNPGELAVAYKINDKELNSRVRHYLIRPEIDLSTRKTLADFLFEHSTFTCAVIVEFDQANDGYPTYKKVRKEQILEPYLTKKVNKPDAPSGYDSNVHNYPFSKYSITKELMEAE